MGKLKKEHHHKSCNNFINNKNVVNIKPCPTKKKIVCHEPRVASRKTRLVSDEICGRIFQRCNFEPKLYWKAEGVKPFGSIRITNDSDCCDMVAIILFQDRWDETDKLIEVIEPLQQISFSLKSIKSISIKCMGHRDECCEGTYALRLHYLISSCCSCR